MSFTGKATYSAGPSLPEIAEDVADLVAIQSVHETPLLSVLGDPAREARSTYHEWLEDGPVGNTTTISDVVSSTVWSVADINIFRVGDQLQVGASERALVTAVDTANTRITVSRGYGGTGAGTVEEDDVVINLGNAALEGADAGTARFSVRSRIGNYTQIFSTTLEVSGSELAVRKIGVRDEMDYQKTMRLRELLRDLENTVINGVAPEANPQGSATVRRSMRGIHSFINTNRLSPGTGDIPSGNSLTEEILNRSLQQVWRNGRGNVDLILVNGREKRRINQFVASQRRFYSVNETYKDMVSVYESDFGTCRIVVSRNVPVGSVLLLDSSRIGVLPLSGRSFHYKPLAATGDRESGQLLGEYTLEFRDEAAHGVIEGFTA